MNFPKTVTAFFSIFIVVATASSAFAQSHPLGEGLGKLDKNGDNKVSAVEFSADTPGLFKKIDANSDKALTLEEVTAFYLQAAPVDDPKTKLRIEKIMKADSSKDGKVTLDELLAAYAADFKKRDTDGDGFITISDKR